MDSILDKYLFVQIFMLIIAVCALTYAGQLDNSFGNPYDIRGTVAAIGYSIIAIVSILAFIGYSNKAKALGTRSFNWKTASISFAIIWIFLFPAPIKYLLGDIDWLTNSPISRAITIISAILFMSMASRELIIDLPMLLRGIPPVCN